MSLPFEGCKVRVPTPEISKKVQEKLFELGYTWWGSKKAEAQYTEEPYLHINKSFLTYSDDGDTDYFLTSRDREISYHEILNYEKKSYISYGALSTSSTNTRLSCTPSFSFGKPGKCCNSQQPIDIGIMSQKWVCKSCDADLEPTDTTGVFKVKGVEEPKSTWLRVR